MGRKQVFLIMVTAENNNKFYNMTDLENGYFKAEWGRINTTSSEKEYPICDWNKIYSSKIKKGYRDVSDTRTVAIRKEYKPLDNPEIQKLIETLQNQSRQYMETKYESLSVTQAMVDQAQEQLNILAECIDKSYTDEHKKLDDFNKNLLILFTIIPRKMRHVEDELVSYPKYMEPYDKNQSDTSWKTKIDNRIKEDMNCRVVSEQNLLDSLKTQVKVSGNKDIEDKTILEAFNITMDKCTDEDMEIIRKAMLDVDKNKFKIKRAWVLRHNERDKQFNQYLINHNLKNDDKTVKYYWHGTRTENVFSIMVNGLQLNPSNAHITGKMFGYGIYSAPKATKSLGYTSLDGSYWAGGRSNVGYMFLNAVIMGHKLNTDSTSYNGIYLSSMTSDKFRRTFPEYHSVYAHRGSYLRNDECIVYEQSQITSRYLVEFERV